MSRLHFVFLQGMPSPFFSRVAGELSHLGCRTTGINLCVGDAIFWRGGNTVNYRGTLADWPAFLAEFFLKHQVTDLVLLGEQRLYHKPAVEVAKAAGVRVTVTDFGYLRPDWITLEKNGMGGNSMFPRDPAEIMKLASEAPSLEMSRCYTDSAFNMAAGDLLYSFSNVFLGWLFPHYRRSDKRPHPALYFPAIGWRLLLAKSGQRRAQERVQALIESKAKYFLFPLQLEHDFQIVAYSPFRRLPDAIRIVMQSFSANAGKDMRLALKLHPWDPGFRNWKKLIAQWAHEFGIADRVHYFDGGSLDTMIAHSAGMITVNSTSGIRALQLGSPVKALGQAVYDMPGLTCQGKLDDFWTDARGPDLALADAFIKAMAATIQIRGVYFSEPGLSNAVREAAQRLHDGKVGVPQSAQPIA